MRRGNKNPEKKKEDKTPKDMAKNAFITETRQGWQRA